MGLIEELTPRKPKRRRWLVVGQRISLDRGYGEEDAVRPADVQSVKLGPVVYVALVVWTFLTLGILALAYLVHNPLYALPLIVPTTVALLFILRLYARR